MVSLASLLGRRSPAPTSRRGRNSQRKVKRATEIFVATDGSDSNDGTQAAPLASIQAAVDLAVAGDTIFLREGTYAPSTNIQFTKSGSSNAPITISNYDGEKVIVDGENLPFTPGGLDATIPSSDRGTFHLDGADWLVFNGLEIIHGPYAIYANGCSNNVYQNLVTRDNYETGLQIQGTSSNNLILNLDSYGNHDPRKNGESADGLGIKEGEGTGNVVRGARLWNNVDDGLDFWEFKSLITVENSYSWGNGYNRWDFSDFQGDGNGFKLGGGDDGETAAAAHVVTNSIAFLNAANGFDYNSQPGAMEISFNTAWNNLKNGFRFAEDGTNLSSNVGILNAVEQADLGSGVADDGNLWSGSNSSFLSIDSSMLTGARASNGSVVGSNFLLLASGDAIGATTWV